MRKRGHSQTRPPAGEMNDPLGLGRLLQTYKEWMGFHNYSEATIKDREFCLRGLIEWLDERDIRKAKEVTKSILEHYQRYLFHYRKTNGRPLSHMNQKGRMSSVREFFKWLARRNHIPFNPASEIELPRDEKRLPRNVMTAAEVETVINETDVKDAIGIRDRAILETLYSTGIRRMELIELGIYDVDVSRGTVMIRRGKGKKDRVVPIGERALAWIDKYQQEVRPRLVAGKDEGRLFLTKDGEVFTTSRMSQLVSGYIERANIGKKGSCHLFRHTMATLMLENGADIRIIQEILGHASVETTQVYTQVSIRRLKQIHEATHPARLFRTPSTEDTTEPDTKELLSSLIN